MGHDPWSDLRDAADGVRRSIESALRVTTSGILEEAPADRGLFALATHAWAKELKASPADVASRAVRAAPASVFEPLRAEGAYVNFRVDPAKFSELVMASVRQMGDRYGMSPARTERILLEHTSVNPTGPLHVGRARNPLLGDSLGRLLRFAGHPVQREYYVNDIGKQMVLLYWAVTNLRLTPEEEAEERIERRYVRLYQRANALLEKDPSLGKEIESLIDRFEGGDAGLTRAIRAVGDRVLHRILAVLTRLDISFDSFFWESDLVLDGSVHRVIERLRPLGKEEDGAQYLDLSPFGLEGDSAKYFFVTRRGTSLYTTRDIAYHLRKMERCDRAINVLGEDQKLSFERLKGTFQLMGINWAPETIYYAFVSLPEGRMSTRKGIVVYLDDLIDEAIERAFAEVSRRREDLSEEKKRAIAETIGLGAIRYNIVRVQAEKAITFRWEEALNFEGNSAPFLQYAHARACSILAKAGNAGPGEARFLLHPQEQRLLRWVAKFPSTLRDAADSRRVHVVASFATDFASQFNQFYRDCPVLTAQPAALREARVQLVQAARVVLRNGLECLGVKAPSEM